MDPLLFAQSVSDVQLARLLQVATLLLVPLALLMLFLLYKILVLLQHTIDFINIARFDVVPMLQDARHITHHISNVSAQVDKSVSSVQKTASKAGPAFNKTKDKAKEWGMCLTDKLLLGVEKLFKSNNASEDDYSTTTRKVTIERDGDELTKKTTTVKEIDTSRDET